VIHWRRHIPTQLAKRIGRVLTTLAALPALALSPLTAQAILIHDHHGHETHAHTLTVHDLDDWREDREHQHEGHDHDGRPAHPTEGEGESILIVLDLPEALPGGRVLSNGATVIAGAAVTPSNYAIAIVMPHGQRASVGGSQLFAHPVRAHGSFRSILLTNHALLI
jgi:hypothetical protein